MTNVTAEKVGGPSGMALHAATLKHVPGCGFVGSVQHTAPATQAGAQSVAGTRLGAAVRFCSATT
jgi:predicted ATP-grasp superfamily ATP-dependent carboligase